MKTLGGFAGKILYVDLTQKTIKTGALDPDMAKKFVGGLGLTIKLAYDRIKPGTDPLSPDNPVVIGAGPLVGTDIPSSSRVYAVTKFPASGTIGWCGAGGVTFGCMFKNAGYDHLIIEGQSDKPVYLKIIDHKVELCDAGELWGKGILDTCETLKMSDGRQGGVISIGQAGENRVTFSMAYVDGIATLGRGGFGAVLGAKKLKAIFVKGSQGIDVADQERYESLKNELLQTIQGYRYLKEWQSLGMLKSFPAVPVETYEKIKKRRIACVSCPLGCKDVVEIKDGRFKGLVARSSSAINLFTPLAYGFTDYREAVKLIATLDEYGLDMFEFFGVMNFAAALFKNGVIPEKENIPEIAMDSLESMEIWAGKIAGREGIGRILADGFAGMLDTYKKDAEDYAPALVKGMHPYTGPDSALPWDLFGTMELGQIMDFRGPHVGSGGSPTYFAKRPLDVFPRHLKRMGVPDPAIARILPDPGAPEDEQNLKIGSLLKYSHRWFSILGSLGICARAQVNRFYNAELCAALYEAVTGIGTDIDQLRLRADRVWTLYKMANVREGVGRNAESIPERWVRHPGFKNYVSEKPVTREEIEQMITDYYMEQGWDTATGIPKAETLKKLGLEDH